MLKNELKAALAIMGTVFVPLFAQADQPMSTSQGQQQQPGYVSGEKIQAGQLPGGYNQSADYMCDNGWDVYLTGDYIWWDWVQDNAMSVGFNGLTGGSLSFDATPANITPGYASGFQVGMGFNMHGMDDWNFYGEYTWYKNSGSRSNVVDFTSAAGLSSVDMTASADIHIKYSNADFLLQRPFYFGKKLTANFYTGLRALWITRNGSASAAGTFDILDGAIASVGAVSFNATNKVSSWALGPKFGFDANWLLGYGFKFLSNISTSVLYTRYTENSTVSSVGDITAFAATPSITSSSTLGISNYGTLRPTLEAYLGLGWGSFFCDDSFHFDLSIGYDFNVFFNYVTTASAAGATTPANMYLHGLNVQLRFDF